jgi:hypothetical protein
VVLDQRRAIVVDARVYAGLLGYRLRPELDATYETMASLLSALSTPGIATRRIPVGLGNTIRVVTVTRFSVAAQVGKAAT